MKTVVLFAMLVGGVSAKAMNIGGAVYRNEFMIFLLVVVSALLTVGYIPEIRKVLSKAYQFVLNKWRHSNPIE
jgi:hypothetical protein